MQNLGEPRLVKLVAGILWTRTSERDAALGAMQDLWGQIDAASAVFAFDTTDYYVDEMGRGISRQFVSFEALVPPDSTAPIKLQANVVEAGLAENGRRSVNIDTGYLDFHKIVLASTKQAPHRVYLSQGIWADITLLYRKGSFGALPWTFPDLGSGTYDAFFLEARGLYRQQLRALAQSGQA